MKTKLAVIFLLVLVVPGMLVAETSSEKSASVLPEVGSIGALPQVGTYEQLVAAIRKARAASQGRVEEAVRQEKVRECWETGKLIDEHVLQHKERADYGKQVIERLAKDLETSERELYYMLEFYRAYPILRAPAELSWSHYEVLLSVSDTKERDALAEKASKEHWTQDQLRAKVKESKAARGLTGTEKGSDPFFTEEKLAAQPGKVGTYRMVKATVGPEAGKLVIDLGFSNYYRTSRPLGFKEGAIIEALFAMSDGSSPSDKIKLSKRTSADLYTYRAYVLRILDGDTIEAVIDLGFGVRSVQTLRLRGIDAPEMVSKEGKEAKEKLEKLLHGATSHEPRDTNQNGDTSHEPRATEKTVGTSVERGTEVLIKTSKSDKYDRYLADVFIDRRQQTVDGRHKTSDKEPAASDFLYVNQVLVERGLATRVKDN